MLTYKHNKILEKIKKNTFENKCNIITEMLTADNAINFVNNIMKFLRIVFLDLKSKKTIWETHNFILSKKNKRKKVMIALRCVIST